MRRRRAALGAAAAAALAVGVAVGAGGSGAGDQTGHAAAAPTCPATVAASPGRLAGEMLIVRMESTATRHLRRALRHGSISGVVLFPPSGVDRSRLAHEIGKLRRIAAHADRPAPIIAIDQEGGEVKRFAELPPSLSPAQMAAAGTKRTRAQGRKTGRALARLGVNVDLAPVADVPAVPGAFIASRAFADSPAKVAELATAFGSGLAETGVAATAKHFPGLGRATQNTDLAPSTIAATRRQLAAGLRPFRAASAAGFGLIMVSNAVYPALDAGRPASLSRRIIAKTLRGRLAYGGVAITDDLGAGAITAAGYDEGEAAVAAAKAGDDLLLFALSEGDAAHRALTRAIRRHGALRNKALAACARVESLRASLGD